MRNGIVAGVLIAVLTAMGGMIVTINSRQFEAQAQMVTQEEFRFELVQFNDRFDGRLDNIERMVRVLFERERQNILRDK